MTGRPLTLSVSPRGHPGQFLSEWLARDPDRLSASLAQFVGPPPTASANCAPTWSASSSCSAAATTGNCSAHDRRGPPGQLSLHGPLRASTSFALALARYLCCTLTPAAAQH